MPSHSVSTLWNELRAQAQLALDTEPTLAALFQRAILDHPDFGCALAQRIGQALAEGNEQRHTLTDRFAGIHHQAATLAEVACCDLQAIVSRDPAFDTALEVFLFSKGYLALQAYRVGHHLHERGERLLAMFIQARCNERLGIDINPASRIGSGIMLDHGTGIVIGETAVVGDDVSILQGVTLGGTGKEGGDRHPKVRSGVMIGAGAKILGNIEIGEGAKVGAGSIVLHPVASHTTVVGNPARQVGKPRHARPALDMDQSFDEEG
ncbi:serine O-acetyltransferase [Pseudomonas stutzeri]|jgi:serine O-acetyltransferase|uniref:Serine acetyltransferase n=1 Tax=Stutzerimonas stutzeri NF13 TaxID=1212548 RepID=M2VQP7_STUST|nr:serine O-acetyltransferase [Stutzerimonas stutzeri]MBS68507.1 serine O-acetyltransferase [Pseudomonas sp.]WOF78286.1 serine O-acetyltransferase [Pseudomonas sp. FeN3W]EME01929.1 serine acetyltransferase [Stutzerimonas stutzeri NF13]MBK3881682.1 serine O-acetyltransferase [Stutzerimonas stutzeri]MCQ4291911.1 serine O-acetyltransferase [Stutzerimonas stutzeri]|tara:strand:+ start:250 stop:1044 length:795 start_codon:yes stop_codon:yes gene_type:complete